MDYQENSEIFYAYVAMDSKRTVYLMVIIIVVWEPPMPVA
jgi:hypothetical protein